MARDTSIEVYRRIEAEGLIQGLRWDVYRALYEYGPMTQMETCRRIGGGRQDRSYMPRFAELKRQGSIVETRKRKCMVTSREVYEWKTTNEIPKKILPRPSKDQRIKELEAYVQELEARLREVGRPLTTREVIGKVAEQLPLFT